jgi:outer membrane immunogenic protein
VLVYGSKPALPYVLAVLLAFGSTTATAADALSDGAGAYWNGTALSQGTCSLGLKQGGASGRFDTRTATVLGVPGSYFYPSSVPAINAVGSQTIHSASITTALQTECNWRKNGLVFGLEGDVSYERLASAAGASATYPCCAPTGFSLTSMAHSTWLVTVRPRIGFVVHNWLPFVSGGLATGNLNGGFVFRDNNSSALASGSVSKTALGLSFGTGVEVALNPNWSLEAEYVEVRLDNVSDVSTNLTTTLGRSPSNVFTQRVDFRARVLTLGANLHF